MRNYVLIVAILLASQSAWGEREPNLGSVMWSAFVCSKYAEMYGNRSEYKRLFELGYHVGMKFINDIKNKINGKCT